jgi:glucose-6-phosphate isomerase, archaeal
MLMEDEETGDSKLVALDGGSIVYVPGHTAHRTINTGAEPLVYIGVFAARAGHDYAAVAARNFRHVVVADGAGATMRAR